MALDKGRFLDALPVPCLYLALNRTIAYTNHLAAQLIQDPNRPQGQLEGVTLTSTGFTQTQWLDAEQLERAFVQLERSIRDGNGSTHSSSFESVSIPSYRQKEAEEESTTKIWQWSLTLVQVDEALYFCLTAHEISPVRTAGESVPFSKTQQWDMLQNITRPAYKDTEHMAAISLHDMSLNSVNECGRINHKVIASSYETGGRQTDGCVWTEDFTKPIAPTEHIPHICLAGSKASQGLVRGLQDETTGQRSIVDLSVTVLNEPFSDKLLGCVLYARPLQEWSQYVLQYDMMAKLTLAEQNQEQHIPLVRTMLLDGTIDYFSPSWQRYSKSSLKELREGGWKDCIHPEDIGILQQCTQAVLQTSVCQTFEVRYRRGSSGDYRYFTDTIAPWNDSHGTVTRWYCISTDNHELVSERLAASLAARRLYNIVHDMDVVIYELDTDYAFTTFDGSLAIRSLDGNDRKVTSFSGIPWDQGMQMVHVEDRAKYHQAVRNAMEGKSAKTMIDYRVGPKHLRSIFVPIRKENHPTDDKNAESGITGVLGLAMDLSAQYASEQARVQIEAMTQASRLKDEFLANISHELRTPIAGILGLLELMVETELSSAQLDLAQSLQSSANGLSRIVNDLLDLSKVEANAMPIEKMPFKLTDIFDDARRSYQALAVSKGLVLDVQAVDQACPMLLGDPVRIRQILYNLLSNAIKFTVKGFVRLTTTVEVKESTAHVNMLIQDTGIGISQETLTKLFQPFAQADQSTTRLYGGSGLGLIIARKLARAMDGDVALTSTEGQGTISSFSLLLDVVDTHVLPEASSSNAESKSQNGSLSSSNSVAALNNISILVAEDNLVNQKVIVGRLRNIGITQVSVAAHGGETIAYMNAIKQGNSAEASIKTGEHKHGFDFRWPDLIFMDCQMPVLDGFETTRQLRSDLKYEGPIIALTASVVKDYRQRCLDAGMSDYLTKPFTRNEFNRVLRSWLPDVSKQIPE